jgi:hypothetical protein
MSDLVKNRTKKLKVIDMVISGEAVATPSGKDSNHQLASDPLPGITLINIAYVTSFVLTMVGNVAVFITFGVVVPILALAMCGTICCQTMYAQYCVGTYFQTVIQSPVLDNAEKLKFFNQLHNDLERLDYTFVKTIWQLLLFLGIFYGFFIFDIIGDEVGYHRALWAPISLLVLTCIIYFTSYFKRVCGAFRRHDEPLRSRDKRGEHGLISDESINPIVL